MRSPSLALLFCIVSMTDALYQLIAANKVAKVSLGRLQWYTDVFGSLFELLGVKNVWQCLIELLFLGFHWQYCHVLFIRGTQQCGVDVGSVSNQAVDDSHGGLVVIVGTDEGLLLIVG